MQKTTTKVDDYINSLDEEDRKSIETLHKTIIHTAPDIKPAMWEGVFWGGSEQKIIGYGDYDYKRSDGKKVEWFVIGLTKQKNYISLFIAAVEDKEYLAEKYADQLGKVKVTKSAVKINKADDVNLETLEILVKNAFKVMKPLIA